MAKAPIKPLACSVLDARGAADEGLVRPASEEVCHGSWQLKLLLFSLYEISWHNYKIVAYEISGVHSTDSVLVTTPSNVYFGMPNQDWKCIVSMLLDENPMIELTDVDATNLARLLYASAKKAVGERIVPTNDNRKPYHNKAQKAIENVKALAAARDHTGTKLDQPKDLQKPRSSSALPPDFSDTPETKRQKTGNGAHVFVSPFLSSLGHFWHYQISVFASRDCTCFILQHVDL